MAVRAAELEVLVTTNTAGAERELRSFGNRMSGYMAGRALKDWGKSALGFIEDSIEAGARFQQEIIFIDRLAGGAGESIDELSKKAYEIDQRTLFMIDDITGGMEQLAREGFGAKRIIDSLADASINASGAMREDVAKTSNALGTVQRIFADQMIGDAEAADILTAAVLRSGRSLAEFMTGGQYVFAIADELGVAFEDVAVALSYLSSEGIKTRSAGTGLRTMFLALASPTVEAQAALDQYNLTAFDAQGNFLGLRDIIKEFQAVLLGLSDEDALTLLETIFGKNASSPLLTLFRGGTEAYDAQLAKMDDLGTAAELMEARYDTLAGSIDRFQSALARLKQMIGLASEWLARPLLDGATTLINLFVNLPGPIIAVTAAFIALAGIVMVLAGSFMIFNALGGFSMFMSALGIIATIGVVAAAGLGLVAGSVVLLATQWYSNAAAFEGIISFWERIKTIWDEIKESVGAGDTTGIMGQIGPDNPMFTEFDNPKTNKFTRFFDGVADGIEKTFGNRGALDGVVGSGRLQTFARGLSDVANYLSEVWRTGKILNPELDKFDGITRSVVRTLGLLVDTAKELFADLSAGEWSDALSDLGWNLSRVSDSIMDAMGDVDWAAVGSAIWGFIEDALVLTATTAFDIGVVIGTAIGDAAVPIAKITLRVAKWAFGQGENLYEKLRGQIIAWAFGSSGVGGAGGTEGNEQIGGGVQPHDLGDVAVKVSGWLIAQADTLYDKLHNQIIAWAFGSNVSVSNVPIVGNIAAAVGVGGHDLGDVAVKIGGWAIQQGKDLLGAIGDFVTDQLPRPGTVLGVIGGATVGAMVGGPLGAAVGAVTGGALVEIASWAIRSGNAGDLVDAIKTYVGGLLRTHVGTIFGVIGGGVIGAFLGGPIGAALGAATGGAIVEIASWDIRSKGLFGAIAYYIEVAWAGIKQVPFILESAIQIIAPQFEIVSRPAADQREIDRLLDMFGGGSASLDKTFGQKLHDQIQEYLDKGVAAAFGKPFNLSEESSQGIYASTRDLTAAIIETVGLALVFGPIAALGIALRGAVFGLRVVSAVVVGIPMGIILGANNLINDFDAIWDANVTVPLESWVDSLDLPTNEEVKDWVWDKAKAVGSAIWGFLVDGIKFGIAHPFGAQGASAGESNQSLVNQGAMGGGAAGAGDIVGGWLTGVLDTIELAFKATLDAFFGEEGLFGTYWDTITNPFEGAGDIVGGWITGVLDTAELAAQAMLDMMPTWLIKLYGGDFVGAVMAYYGFGDSGDSGYSGSNQYGAGGYDQSLTAALNAEVERQRKYMEEVINPSPAGPGGPTASPRTSSQGPSGRDLPFPTFGAGVPRGLPSGGGSPSSGGGVSGGGGGGGSGILMTFQMDTGAGSAFDALSPLRGISQRLISQGKQQLDTKPYEAFIQNVRQILGKLPGIVLNEVMKAQQQAVTQATALNNAVTNQFVGLMNNVRQIMGTLPGIIAGYSGEMFNAGFNVGRNAGSGMVAGMDSQLGAIQARAQAMANIAITALSRALNLGSPSKVFMQLGAYAAQGFAIGLSDTAGTSRAGASMASAAYAGAAAHRGASVRAGSDTYFVIQKGAVLGRGAFDEMKKIATSGAAKVITQQQMSTKLAGRSL